MKSPIDNFILAKLEAKGLAPAPPADRRTLIRRATFDLTGLPPTPEEIRASSTTSRRTPSRRSWTGCWPRLPMGSAGAATGWTSRATPTPKAMSSRKTRSIHNAYTYRDWVIRALNEDLPYDQFIIQQFAADKLPLGDDRRPLAALGFLTVGTPLPERSGASSTTTGSMSPRAA